MDTENYVILYNVINIFCILLALTLFIHSKKNGSNNFKDRCFRSALISLIIFFLSDEIWYTMDQGLMPYNIVISHMLKFIYFASGGLCGYLWFLYFEYQTNNRLFKRKRMLIYTAFLEMLLIVMLIINIFTGIFFSISYDDIAKVQTYTRGPVFVIQYVIIYLYIFFSAAQTLLFALKPENQLDRLKYLVLASFPIIPAICVLIQYFMWRFPIACCGLSLAIFILYLADLSSQVSIDNLTDINNRKEFMKILQRNLNSLDDNEVLYMFMLDLDEFKNINDTYGHLEGDNALKIFANTLKQSCMSGKRKSACGRFGGDEFALLSIISKDDDINSLITDIDSELKKGNSKIEYDYQISYSYGYSESTKSDKKELKELIELADNNLYDNKKKKKISR